MIENYRSRLIWELMKKNSYIRQGLERAGLQWQLSLLLGGDEIRRRETFELDIAGGCPAFQASSAALSNSQSVLLQTG